MYLLRGASTNTPNTPSDEAGRSQKGEVSDPEPIAVILKSLNGIKLQFFGRQEALHLHLLGPASSFLWGRAAINGPAEAEMFPHSAGVLQQRSYE
jgi:hypothetical protein